MIVRAKIIVALSVLTLALAAISLPVVSLAATSPSVLPLSPLVKGLFTPLKIALGAEGNVYVADRRHGGVVKFNAYGEQLMVIQTSVDPTGLAFAQDGTLLVSQESFVARYNVATGQEVGRLTGGQLRYAAGIAVDDVTGYIYVADSLADQVEIYTASGDYIKSFAKGARTTDANGAIVLNPMGKLAMPTGVSFEKVSRQIAVADTLNHRVQFFDLDGNFVRSIGNPISTVLYASVGQMQFFSPVAVAFEYSKDQPPVLSRIYVVDSLSGTVQVIDPGSDTVPASALTVAGTVANYINYPWPANGSLMVPNDAVFDAKNSRLLVVNGFGNVTIYGIDGGTNPVYVDVTPPVFTVNRIPAEVTVNTLTISGTVEAGSAIQIAAGSTAAVEAVVYSGSSWSAPVTALALGNNSFTITAKDVAGNIAAPQAVNVSYLLPAPAVTISPVPSVTKGSTVTISGTVDTGATVVVANQSASASVDAVVAGTSWSCKALLVEGANNLVATAQIPQSVKSQAAVTVTLDTVAPVLNVSALANGSNAGDPVQNISGTVTDLNGASLMVNGTAAKLEGNAFSVPVTLMNGSNQISVVAMDAAGNTTVDNRTLNYNAGSGLTVLSPVDNSITANTTQIISGTVDGSLTITVAGIPATVQANSWSASVELLPGVNTIEIVATDLVGNSSSVKRSVTLDAVRPMLAVDSPAQDVAVNVPNVSISGTVSDATALVLEYTLNGATFPVTVNTGNYSFNVDFAAEGNYPVTLTAKDAAGNTSTVVRTIIYDKTPPAFTLNQVNGVMPEKLSGTVEAGSSIVVKDGTAPIGSVSIVNGSWTANLTGVIYIPENLLAVATDAAGNSTSKALVYNFPDGTLNGSGHPTIKDARRAMYLAAHKKSIPTANELAHYDIGPLINGKPNPNGKIDLVDALLILRKALGLKSSW